MTEQNYTVPFLAPIHIQEQAGREILIYNSGTVTVYLGSTPGMNAITGFPLNVGAVKVWSPDTPLYAITASAAGKINTTDNIGGLFDPSSIATAITGGTILSPTAVASAINVAGVPAIDKNTVVIDFNALFPTGFSAGAGGSSPFTDVSSYQSIRYCLGENQLVSTTRQWTFTWCTDVFGGSTLGQDVVYSPVFTGQIVGVIPVRGPFLRVTAGATVNSGTLIPSKIYGSFRAAPKATFNILLNGQEGSTGLMTSDTFGNQDGLASMGGTFTNGMTEFPDHRAGEAVWSVELASVVVSPAKIQILNTVSSRLVASMAFPVSASLQSQIATVILPFCPIIIRFTLGGNSAGNLGLVSVEY